MVVKCVYWNFDMVKLGEFDFIEVLFKFLMFGYFVVFGLVDDVVLFIL